MRASDLLLEPVKKYRQSINPPYRRKDIISILGTLFILLALPLTVFVAVKVRPWGPRAAGTAAAPTTIGSVVEPGSMVSGASYIVFVDGSNYYAKDGKTGEVKFSDSDAAVVINAAIAALPSGGGKVVLTEGVFTIRSSILRPPRGRLWLEGQGISTTEIKLASGINDYCFKKSAVGDAFETKISNLTFNVDKANNPNGGGINVTGLPSLILADVWVYKPGSKYGIYGNGDLSKNGDKFDGQTWYNIRVTEGSSDGIHLIAGAAYVISHSQSNLNGGNGWYIQEAYESFFDAIDTDQNGGWSVVLNQVNRSSLKIKDCEGGLGGVNVIGYDTTRNIIELQSYRSPKVDSSGAGLRIAGTADGGPHDNYFLVDIGEHYVGKTNSVVLEASAGRNNTITGHVEGSVINNSQGNIFQDLKGYKTENSGTATNVADGGTITHGLAGVPTYVQATPSVAGEIVSVTAKNSSTFTVAIKKPDGSSGTPQAIYWKAEVK